MKYTHLIAAFWLLLIFGMKEAKAVTYLANPNIKIVTIAPTATPTPIIVKKIDSNINLKIIATNTPTPVVVTKVVTATAAPTTTVTATVTSTIGASPSGEIASPTAKIENVQNNSLSKWFTWITLGLLIVILIIQLLSKKKEE